MTINYERIQKIFVVGSLLFFSAGFGIQRYIDTNSHFNPVRYSAIVKSYRTLDTQREMFSDLGISDISNIVAAQEQLELQMSKSEKKYLRSQEIRDDDYQIDLNNSLSSSVYGCTSLTAVFGILGLACGLLKNEK